MKIYRIYNGKLESIEVETETALMYYVKRSNSMGYRERVRKNSAHLTPKDAVREYKNELHERIAFHINRLESANNEMEIALKLESDLEVTK